MLLKGAKGRRKKPGRRNQEKEGRREGEEKEGRLSGSPRKHRGRDKEKGREKEKEEKRKREKEQTIGFLLNSGEVGEQRRRMKERESKVGGIEGRESDRSPKNDFFRATINTFRLSKQEFTEISRTVIIINEAASIGVQEMVAESVLLVFRTVE